MNFYLFIELVNDAKLVLGMTRIETLYTVVIHKKREIVEFITKPNQCRRVWVHLKQKWRFFSLLGQQTTLVLLIWTIEKFISYILALTVIFWCCIQFLFRSSDKYCFYFKLNIEFPWTQDSLSLHSACTRTVNLRLGSSIVRAASLVKTASK